MNANDPVHVAAEIERVIQSLTAFADPDVAARGRELARLIMLFYGAGLSRVVDLARDESGEPRPFIERLAADPLVSNLLVLHDIHPHSAAERIGRALAAVQQALPAGTTLSLVSCAHGRARVCVSLPDTSRVQADGVRQAIERAVGDAAPEITAIDVDGLPLQLLQILRSPTAVGAG